MWINVFLIVHALVFVDSPYIKGSNICHWILNTAGTCNITITSNPSVTNLVALKKNGVVKSKR